MIVSKNTILQNFDPKRFDYSLNYFFQTSPGRKSVKISKVASLKMSKYRFKDFRRVIHLQN